MIKLIFDMKCGYESMFMTERNAEFPLDLLTNKVIADAYSLLGLSIDKLKSEEEIVQEYSAYPEKLIKDFNLFAILRSIVGAEYWNSCFRFLKTGDCQKRFFPELFTLENVRLVNDLPQPTDPASVDKNFAKMFGVDLDDDSAEGNDSDDAEDSEPAKFVA